MLGRRVPEERDPDDRPYEADRAEHHERGPPPVRGDDEEDDRRRERTAETRGALRQAARGAALAYGCPEREGARGRGERAALADADEQPAQDERRHAAGEPG